MSLKSFFTFAVALLGTLAVSATASLIILPPLLHRASDQLWSAVEGVRMVEELEVDLLTHYRLAHPTLATSSQQGDPQAVEQSLRRHLASAGQAVDSEPERQLLARAQESVESYLSTFPQAGGLLQGAHTSA